MVDAYYMNDGRTIKKEKLTDITKKEGLQLALQNIHFYQQKFHYNMLTENPDSMHLLHTMVLFGNAKVRMKVNIEDNSFSTTK